MILGFTVAVLYPGHRSFNRHSGPDGYPLSWYPMFSGKRDDTLKVTYMYALDAKGKRYTIPYNYWARGGFNQGRSQLRKAVRQGKKATIKKCEFVAERLAKKKSGWRSRVEKVRVAKGRFDVEQFFVEGNREPLRELIKAECPVVRDTSEKEGAK